ncbi:protein-disulfide reductase DsbD family protein [Pseudoalteromonas sp. P94(2023)]|uniref:Protein-disulfide reductase DsbD family protein n=2 Tax=Pseudoalteromonas obscura TaxID=3048491 RepID=A0ABT7EKP8_9GAMM|nr:protein-disulfide reductase DsbD family protein [Pseudoalteromonas sp. P94(2023)]
MIKDIFGTDNCMVKLIFIFLLVFSCGGFAQNSATGPHIEVSLVSETSQLSIGKTHWIGIILNPEQGWHTYWLNPGDSGEAPKIEWHSDAIEFGNIQWPIPKAIEVAHLVNYGYEGRTLLMVPITLKEQSLPHATIKADLSWLVCNEDCIPGWAKLELDLPIVPTGQSIDYSDHQALFEQTHLRLANKPFIEAKFELSESHIALQMAWPYQSNWQIFPFRGDVIQHNAAQDWTQSQDVAQLVLPLSDYFSSQPDSLKFLLSDGGSGYYVNALPNSPDFTRTDNTASKPFWVILVFAFLGGLILNIMPCVLPVLSMKALALSSAECKSHWGYPLGVIISFWLFAAVVISLKAAGSAVGWGFHLQEPLLIAALAFLFTFIAMMLWDLLPPSVNMSGIGHSLTQGSSFFSQFFTGVLAVIVASPCTAPFMATALGVAMLSPAFETWLVFTALAVGFALPMTLLPMSSHFAKLLPKPGTWMETFKHFLGFPMLATVVWLVWVFLSQTSSMGQLWLLSGLLLFALFIWLSSKMGRPFSYIFMLMALGIATLSSMKGTHITSDDQQLGSDQFSEQKLSQLRNENHVVVVNMTADWCITCKVNEQVAFKDDALKALFEEGDIDYLVGDWTNKNTTILNYLKQYQRSGVPLYIVYAGNHSKQILPQVLTPEIVIDAIYEARKEINNATSN